MALFLKHAVSADHFQQVRALMAEYIAWDKQRTAALGYDVQVLENFYYAGVHADLPGEYAPPAGCLLLAELDGQAAGCAGYRPLSPEVCELKRLFVRPAFRGQRVGRRLAETLFDRARVAGYAIMRLETTTFMLEAQALYRSLGFVPCAPYYDIPATFPSLSIFMERSLAPVA